MSVIVENGMIRLVGACPVEDAEPLLAALQDDPLRKVDVSAMTAAHSAVIQLLALFAREIEGAFADPVLGPLLGPLLGPVIGGTSALAKRVQPR